MSTANDRPRSLPRSTRPGRVTRGIQEMKAVVSTVEEAANDVERFVREQTERRPYTSVAAAAGAGYVLGGGNPMRIISVLFALSGRFAIEMLIRDLSGGSPSTAGARTVAPARQRSVSW